MTRTDRKEVTGARRDGNKAVLVRVKFEPSEKGYFFGKERCFFS